MFSKIFVIVSFLSCLIFFQNCAKVQFSDTAQINTKLGTESELISINEVEDRNVELPTIETPAVDAPIMTVSEQFENTIAYAECKDLKKMEDAPFLLSQSEQDEAHADVQGHLLVNPVRNLMVSEVAGHAKILSALKVTSISGIKGHLNMTAGQVVNVSDVAGHAQVRAETIGSISGVQGHASIGAKSIAQIKNIRGKVCVHSQLITRIESVEGSVFIISRKTESGAIDSISQVGGNLIIKNMNINSIRGVSGNIHIIGGSIKSIDGVAGNVYLEKSTAGTITNVQGHVQRD